jgi:hypothetical protein
MFPENKSDTIREFLMRNPEALSKLAEQIEKLKYENNPTPLSQNSGILFEYKI